MNPRIKKFSANILLIVLAIVCGLGVFGAFYFFYAQNHNNGLITAGNKAKQDKEYSKAIELFKEAESVFPEDSSIKRELSSLYLQKGKLTDAIEYLHKIPDAQKNTEDYDQLGKIYYSLKDSNNAIKYWEKTKDRSPQHTYLLAQLYYDQNNIDAYFNQLTKISSYQEPALLLQVRNIKLTEILESAKKAAELELLEKDSPLPLALFTSQIQNALNQQKSGKQDFAELIQIAAFANLNQCKLLDSRIENLLIQLKQKNIPITQLSYFKGVCLTQKGNAQESIPFIQEVIQADPSVSEYRLAQAKNYFLVKDKVKLIATFNDLLLVDKKPDYYKDLANYLDALGDYQAAVDYYNQALNLSTDQKQKSSLALTITQINLLKLKKLDSCTAPVLQLLQENTDEIKIIKGHCSIYNKQTMPVFDGYIKDYFTALQQKNKEQIAIILDRDTTGLLTKYHNQMGQF